MALQIKLFGGPVVINDTGQLLQFPTRKSEALLAYLVEQRGKALSRETLADLLWPYSGPDQARASLRQEISVVRKALGADNVASIFSEGDRIGFSEGDAVVDLWCFNEIDSETVSRDGRKELLALYTAPFLDTFRIRSQPFSDWVWATRQTQEARALRFGDTLMAQWADAGFADNLTEIAQHLCRIDPTYEPAHCGLVEYYVRQGDFHLAKHQMRQCEVALKTHLDTEPSFETRRLAATLEKKSIEPRRQIIRPSRPEEQAFLAQQRRFVLILSVLADNRSEDPEEYEQIAKDLAALTNQIIQARGGVQLHLGNDRIHACFGYPTTHDKIADAAVGAAFDIGLAMGKEPARYSTCRIGISAGLALVSIDDQAGNSDFKVSGAVQRDAEDLARAAPPGAVYVSTAVKSLLSSAIRLKEVDSVDGVQEAIANHLPKNGQPWDLSQGKSHVMVGREAQLAQILGNLTLTKSAVGSAVAITGAPGTGKSRLVEEVAVVARDQGFDIKYFHGNMNEKQSTLAPVIDYMQRAGAFGNPENMPVAHRLEQWLSNVDPELSMAADYFASLTGNSTRTATNGAPIPKSVKERALDFFATHAGLATVQQPVLMVFEDIHWFDPTTCEAIGRLIEALGRSCVCVLLVARDGEFPEVLGHPLVQNITLSPLDVQSAEALLRGLLKDTQVSTATLSNILERAEGNPLFLEEFAKAAEASSKRSVLGEVDNSIVDPISGEEVIGTPDRLSPLLLSRIDIIPGAVRVLQHASILGRRFSLSQLSKILHPVAILSSLFNELEAAGIIFATNRGRDTTYIFKHALINEAIYSTIPMRSRSILHKSAALALNSDEMPVNDGKVARHYRAANAHKDAGHFFERSGDQAGRVSAHAEAIFEYSDALVMIGHLPLSRDRMYKELLLNRKIAAQIIGLHGIPTSEATPFYTIANELSCELADQEEAVNAAWGLWSIHLMVAELDDCLNIVTAAEEGLDWQASPVARLIVDYMLGVTHAYRGTLNLASEHLENVGGYDNQSMTDDLLNRFGMDIRLTADSFLAWVYALQGQTNNAAAASQRALDRAKRNKNGLSHVFAHVFSATKCLFLGQLKEARQLAEIGLKGAQEMQFKQWIAQSKMQLARVADLMGDPGALEALQEAMSEYRQANMVLARPYMQVWIAEAMIRRRLYREALMELDELREFTAVSQECFFDSAAQVARELAQEKLASDENYTVFSDPF